MQYNQHGDFVLRWVDDVLLLCSLSVWNEECSIRLGQVVKETLEARQGRPFAVLNDCRKWEGVTPKATEIYFESFFKHCADCGMNCFVGLMPTDFHSLMVDNIVKKAAALVPIKMSVSLKEGCDWLTTQGYPVEQSQFLDT